MRKKWVTIILPLSKRFWSRKPTTFRQIIYSHGVMRQKGSKYRLPCQKWKNDSATHSFFFSSS